MGKCIDLHIHSTMSDGSHSPAEIITLAAKIGLSAIALTDHDSIEGVAEATRQSKALNIGFLTGIEFSVLYESRLLHILALGFDMNNPQFCAAYSKMKIAREENIPTLLEQLKKQEVSLDINCLKNYALTKQLDRYALMRFFMAQGTSLTVQQIWDVYLDPISYGPDEIMSAEEVLSIIKAAGGLTFLAHYNKPIGLAGFSANEMEEQIKDLKHLGLSGIETYYPSYSSTDKDFAEYLVVKYGLLASGGTDFHGTNRPNIQLGTGNGDMTIPYCLYEQIAKRIR